MTTTGTQAQIVPEKTTLGTQAQIVPEMTTLGIQAEPDMRTREVQARPNMRTRETQKMLEESESVGSVLSRAYQRVVDRLNTPSARVPTESVQIQNVPQMVTMGTQSEYGGMNVFQQTTGGKKHSC